MGLGYNVAYHLHCELALDSGRNVILHGLHQGMTYAGWLEGTPAKPWNDGIIERSLRAAGHSCTEGAQPVLIAPARRDYARRPGDMEEWMRTSEWFRSSGDHPPEYLPAVTCVGVFRSGPTGRDPNMDESRLTVVWFQGEFGPPIDEAAVRQLRSLDWESQATDIML